jgi:hypothetical protein
MHSSWSTRFTFVRVRPTLLHLRRCISTTRSKMPRILCVAEKPSISKAVAGHLSGGRLETVCVYVSMRREDRRADNFLLYLAQHSQQIHQKLLF